MAIAVENPIVDVFEKWSDAMKLVVGNDNVAMSSSSLVASTPYARMFMMGNPTYKKDVEGDEVAVTLSVQVEVYASGKKVLENLYSYDQTSHNAMVNMGFQRFFGAELIDNADDEIKRLISRYSIVYTNAGLLK